jgi:hypothetical protein
VVKLVSYNSPHQLDEEAIVMTEIAQNDVVDVGGGVGGWRKVFELEARRPLSSPASSPMQGRKAEGCGVADGDEKQGEGGKGEEDDSESQAEYGRGRRGLSAGCARL